MKCVEIRKFPDTMTGSWVPVIPIEWSLKVINKQNTQSPWWKWTWQKSMLNKSQGHRTAKEFAREEHTIMAALGVWKCQTKVATDLTDSTPDAMRPPVPIRANRHYCTSLNFPLSTTDVRSTRPSSIDLAPGSCPPKLLRPCAGLWFCD